MNKLIVDQTSEILLKLLNSKSFDKNNLTDISIYNNGSINDLKRKKIIKTKSKNKKIHGYLTRYGKIIACGEYIIQNKKKN